MKYWKQILAFGLSFFFLYLTLRGVDFSSVPQYIKHFKPSYLIVASAVYLLQFLIRAFRWQVILSPAKRVSTRDLFDIMLIGFMGNALLPARLGEVIRMSLLSRREELRFSTSMASVMVERLFDGVGMFFIMMLTLFLVPFSKLAGGGINIGKYVRGFFVIFAGLLFLIVLSYILHKGIILFVNKLPFLPVRAKNFIEREIKSFVQGFHIVRNVGAVLKVLLFSFVLWLIIALFYVLFIKAFTFSAPVNAIKAGLVITVITAIGVSVPSAPGYTGPFHYAIKLSFLALVPTLTETEIAVFAVVVHLWFIGLTVLFGFWALWDFGMSFKDITKFKNAKQED